MMPLIAHDSAPDVARFSAIEVLRDGRRVAVRALWPTDLPALLDAIRRVSESSLLRRFFGVKRHFSEKEIDYFVHVDFISHVALVCLADAGRGPIIAGGRYVLVRPSVAELAFVVTDAYQGQGLGAALLRHLVSIARDAGLRQLIAEVLAENAPMLRVFNRSGLHQTTRRDGAVVHVALDL
jgi:GNAT superfamily N-acetyltransferase